MRKLVLFFGMAALLAVSTAAAADAPTGTLTIVGQTATSATVLYEQTSGEPVRVELEHYCYAGDVYAGGEFSRATGTATVTVYTGPRRYKGATLTPDHCWMFATQKLSSSTGRVLAAVDTLDTR